MARIPLIEEPDRPDLADIIAANRAARGGRFLNLYKILLYNPALAEAWQHLIDALRATSLDLRLRELCIIRAAILNDSAYEIRQHIPRYAQAAGLVEAEWSAIADWESSPLFSDRDRAVLAYTDAITRHVHVSDEVFEPLRQHLNNQEIMELTLFAAAYNMHARFMEPLKIDLEP